MRTLNTPELFFIGDSGYDSSFEDVLSTNFTTEADSRAEAGLGFDDIEMPTLD
jgi:hypothetical protein